MNDLKHRKLGMDELGRLSPEEFQQSAHRPIVLLLDNIRSLQNVGAIFRTADAFNIEALALCGFTGTPPHRELHRAALGAEDTVAWQHFEHAMDALEHYGDQGYRILALEQCEGSVPLQTYEAHPQDRLLLILGNEVNGVDQALASRADVCLEIPQHGTKHSLNVATAAGIALWQLVLPYL